MPLYELKSGAHFMNGKNHTAGSKLELSEETAKHLSQYHQLELAGQGEVENIPADETGKPPQEDTHTSDVVDWESVLKSSSIGKILLIVKKTDDRVVLESILAAEEKGQNREKVTSAVKIQLTASGGMP